MKRIAKTKTYRATRPSLFRPAQKHGVGFKDAAESEEETEERKHDV